MLTASEEEIADYDSSFEGYRLALMDTMGDVIVDIVGSFVGLLFIGILFCLKPSLATMLITPYQEEIPEVVVPLPDKSEPTKSHRN